MTMKTQAVNDKTLPELRQAAAESYGWRMPDGRTATQEQIDAMKPTARAKYQWKPSPAIVAALCEAEKAATARVHAGRS